MSSVISSSTNRLMLERKEKIALAVSYFKVFTRRHIGAPCRPDKAKPVFVELLAPPPRRP